MKKIAMLMVVLLPMMSAVQAQRHIEFKWHGFYSVVDLSVMTNLNRSADSYSNDGPQTGPDDASVTDLNPFFRAADTVTALGASVIVGYQFRKEAAVGVGASFIYDPAGAFTQVPLFVELRSHILRSQLTPYWALQAGYSLPVGSSSEVPQVKIDEGGFYFGFEAGGRYAISRTFAVGAHLGYKLLRPNYVTRFDINNEPVSGGPAQLHMLSGGLSFHF